MLSNTRPDNGAEEPSHIQEPLNSAEEPDDVAFEPDSTPPLILRKNFIGFQKPPKVKAVSVYASSGHIGPSSESLPPPGTDAAFGSISHEHSSDPDPEGDFDEFEPDLPPPPLSPGETVCMKLVTSHSCGDLSDSTEGTFLSEVDPSLSPISFRHLRSFGRRSTMLSTIPSGEQMLASASGNWFSSGPRFSSNVESDLCSESALGKEEEEGEDQMIASAFRNRHASSGSRVLLDSRREEDEDDDISEDAASRLLKMHDLVLPAVIAPDLENVGILAWRQAYRIYRLCITRNLFDGHNISSCFKKLKTKKVFHRWAAKTKAIDDKVPAHSFT